MTIQYSIIGTIIVASFYAIALGALWLLARRTKESRLRWIVIPPCALVLLALPWVDELWVAWQFREACRDSGAMIKRQVRANGFYNGITTGSSDAGPVTGKQRIEALEKSAFAFSEVRLLNGKVAHVERVNGSWYQSNLDAPTARYHFKRPTSDVEVARAVSCTEEVVLDTQTNETIARYRYCKRYAALPARLWQGLVHGGPTQYCPIGDKELKGVLSHHVLLPMGTQ